MENKSIDTMKEDIINWFDSGYIDEFFINLFQKSEEELKEMTEVEKNEYMKNKEAGCYTRRNIRRGMTKKLEEETDINFIKEMYSYLQKIYKWNKEMIPWLNTELRVISIEEAKLR